MSLFEWVIVGWLGVVSFVVFVHYLKLEVIREWSWKIEPSAAASRWEREGEAGIQPRRDRHHPRPGQLGAK